MIASWTRPRRLAIHGGVFLTLAAAHLFAVALALGGCASVPSAPAHGHLRIATDDGAVVFEHATGFVTRNPERVVSLRGVGEVHVGVGGDERACRLVWSKAGLSQLAIFVADDCAAVSPSRLCFNATRFVRDGAADAAVPQALVVTGCVDDNTLLWSKVSGGARASIGPRSYRRRCAAVAQPARGCDRTWLRVVRARAQGQGDASRGATFTFDADANAWSVCFLESDSGDYDVELELADSCGAIDTQRLAGDSANLPD